jgi:hypothetical protein
LPVKSNSLIRAVKDGSAAEELELDEDEDEDELDDDELDEDEDEDDETPVLVGQGVLVTDGFVYLQVGQLEGLSK